MRCTECGRFQSANDTATALRPWLNRATVVFIAGWVLFLVALFIHLGIAEGAISYATLDRLTIHGGYTQSTTASGRTIRRYDGRYGPLEVYTDFEEHDLFITVVLGSSFLIAFSGSVLLVVCCPHWRKAAYIAVATFLPLAAGGVVAFAWHYEAPHLFAWGLQYMSVNAAAQVIGAILGVMLGRPLARLAVRILLPPGVRPRLAFLWLADGKPPPRRSVKSSA